MTQGEFRTYLIAVACLAAAIGLVNLARPTKRWLGMGSVLLGLAALLYLVELPMLIVAIPCVLAVFALGRDAAGRVGRKA